MANDLINHVCVMKLLYKETSKWQSWENLWNGEQHIKVLERRCQSILLRGVNECPQVIQAAIFKGRPLFLLGRPLHSEIHALQLWLFSCIIFLMILPIFILYSSLFFLSSFWFHVSTCLLISFAFLSYFLYHNLFRRLPQLYIPTLQLIF